mmetsp:Transcript_1723/g.6731  ORF Transcript_1723/g.6731 Transcript_1723/m.6731 type:complete len:96 (+) Transcript_1723:1714-2001(+)
MTLSAWNASRPVVGSSAKMTEGSDSSSHAMATRLRSPPDTPPLLRPSPIGESRHARSPMRETTLSTRPCRSVSLIARGSLRRAAIASVSRTESWE